MSQEPVYQLPLQPAVPYQQGALVGSVRTDARIVIVDDTGEPLGVLSAHELADQPDERPLAHVLGHLPPILVVDSNEYVAEAYKQSVALELGQLGSLVVMRHDRSVVGVLTGENLARAFRHALRRRPPQDPHAGMVLPGPIRIPKIVRSCQYRLLQKLCAHIQQFPRKPAQMPRCVDPKGLGPHDFGW
jgi:hypothetical protein